MNDWHLVGLDVVEFVDSRAEKRYRGTRLANCAPMRVVASGASTLHVQRWE